jgi:site-specific recombinase XerC
VLHALDVRGVLRTAPEERRVRLRWPRLLPQDESQRLVDAERKLNLGVPRRRVLAELGYGAGALAEEE